MTWANLPATQTTDWSALAFLQQFRDAVEERQFYSASPTFPAVVAGDNPFDHLLSWQQWVMNQIDVGIVGGFQARSRWIVPGSFDLTKHTGVITGPAWDTVTNSSDRFDYEGIGDGGYRRPYDGFTPDRFWPLVNGQSGFTRKRPREISDPGSGLTPDGDAAGDLARNTSDRGRIYRWSGSSWALHDDQSAQPDTLTSYGVIQPGDYWGSWLWNELQAALQQLREWVGRVFSIAKLGSGSTDINVARFGSGSAPISPPVSAPFSQAELDRIDAAREVAYDDAKANRGPWETAAGSGVGLSVAEFATASNTSSTASSSVQDNEAFFHLQHLRNHVTGASVQLYWHWEVEPSSTDVFYDYGMGVPRGYKHAAVFGSAFSPLSLTGVYLDAQGGNGAPYRSPLIVAQLPADLPAGVSGPLGSCRAGMTEIGDPGFDGVLAPGYLHYSYTWQYA